MPTQQRMTSLAQVLVINNSTIMKQNHTPEDDSGTKCRLFVFCSQWLWPWHFNFGDFCTNAPNAKLHHRTFNRSEVIMRTDKQTNKQTLLKIFTSLRYAMRVGKHTTANRHQLAPKWLVHKVGWSLMSIFSTNTAISQTRLVHNIYKCNIKWQVRHLEQWEDDKN